MLLISSETYTEFFRSNKNNNYGNYTQAIKELWTGLWMNRIFYILLNEKDSNDI